MKKFLIFIASVCALICAVLGLAACSGADEYSVTCQECEHGRVTVSDTKAEAGEKVILAAHPDAGYKFTAFILDGEILDGCSFVMPEKDVAVSATFEVITYSITYVLNGAAVSGNNPETYTVENATGLYAPEKEGYEVCGWYTYSNKPEIDYYNWDIEDFRVTSLEGLYGNLTLYAKYYNLPHWISVSGIIDGECFIENFDGEAYYGETYNIIAEPYSGYELDYIEVNGERIEGTSFTMPACDVEITAEFKPVKYAITYVLDGGTNSPDNPDFYTVEDGYFYLNDAEKDGYIFYGWYFDGEFTNSAMYGIDANIREPITLYAWFVEEENYY